MILTSPINIDYEEITKRQASFASWPCDSAPFIEGLVRAGFFYNGGTNSYMSYNLYSCCCALQNRCKYFEPYGRCPLGFTYLTKLTRLKRT